MANGALAKSNRTKFCSPLKFSKEFCYFVSSRCVPALSAGHKSLLSALFQSLTLLSVPPIHPLSSLSLSVRTHISAQVNACTEKCNYINVIQRKKRKKE